MTCKSQVNGLWSDSQRSQAHKKHTGPPNNFTSKFYLVIKIQLKMGKRASQTEKQGASESSLQHPSQGYVHTKFILPSTYLVAEFILKEISTQND